MTLTDYDNDDLKNMYLEIQDLRKKCLEYLNIFGYDTFSQIATKQIEHDIEQEVGRRELK